MRTVNGPILVGILAEQKTLIAQSPEIYAKYAARLEAAILDTAKKRDILMSTGPKPPSRRAEPPVPGKE